VGVYLRVGPGEVPGMVDRVLQRGASILELGSATGNVTRELRRLGYAVTAVDESAQMLEHVAAPTIRSPIEELRLGTRFDAVLLASHLLNLVPPPIQQRFLDVSAVHLAPHGKLILELHDPAYFEAAPLEHRTDTYVFRLYNVARLAGGRTSATFSWQFADAAWEQHVTVYEFDQQALDSRLAAAGLRRTGCIADVPYWVVAEPIAAGGGAERSAAPGKAGPRSGLTARPRDV
jgi:SAM-dependent methyltransferase